MRISYSKNLLNRDRNKSLQKILLQQIDLKNKNLERISILQNYLTTLSDPDTIAETEWNIYVKTQRVSRLTSQINNLNDQLSYSGTFNNKQFVNIDNRYVEGTYNIYPSNFNIKTLSFAPNYPLRVN